MSFEAPKFTTAGKRLELRALEGEELIFTSIKIGSGQITTQTPSALTDLIKVEETGSINTIKRHDGYVTIQAVFNNASRAAGFYWREVGLYAQDPDDRTKEILYAYQNAYDLAEYINPTSLVEKKINIIAIVDDAESVQALIDESLVYATVESVSNKIAEHNIANNAHSDKFDTKADKLENGHGIVRSVNNQYADDRGNVNLDGFQVGDIKWSAADLTQAGFLVANGASVRRDTYPDLFKAIGTRWGSVDDEHFNLPNLIGKFAEGSESAGGYKEAGLPNIEGRFGGVVRTDGVEVLNGCLRINATDNSHLFNLGNNPDYQEAIVDFDASRSSSIYGKSSTVQPPSVLLTPYIKAFAGASASSTDIEITKVAQDVADKANRDLSNLSEQGRKAFFPSDTYVNIPVPDNRTNITAPANGYYYMECYKNIPSNSFGGLINQNSFFAEYFIANGFNEGRFTAMIPVKKGDIVLVIYDRMKKAQVISLNFIYAEGEV